MSRAMAESREGCTWMAQKAHPRGISTDTTSPPATAISVPGGSVAVRRWCRMRACVDPATRIRCSFPTTRGRVPPRSTRPCTSMHPPTGAVRAPGSHVTIASIHALLLHLTQPQKT